MKPTLRKYVITIGDSLSDRGTFFGRYLLGLYPMKRLSGLENKSPQGRFTNGFVWSDHVSAMIANEILIRQVKAKRHWDSTDIADAVITHSLPNQHSPHQAYSLNNHQLVNYHGKNILRSYNEAGLTAHDYHWIPSKNAKLSLVRNLVSTLSKMRQTLFDYDEANAITAEQKEQTVVIDWSGANDLLIANLTPSFDAVDKAIQARVANIKHLIDKGYRQFILFNLPDLILTPRYQSKSEEERSNAHECSVYFNDQLKKVCHELVFLHSNCSIEHYDVNDVLVKGYQRPEEYGLETKKSKTPYTKSQDYKSEKPSAKGYTFWDDLHFTSYVHALIGERIYSEFFQEFDFTLSEGDIPCKAPKSTSMNKGKLIIGALSTAAAVIGLKKLGVSSTASAAVGVGLAALGLFAPRLSATCFNKTTQPHTAARVCSVAG